MFQLEQLKHEFRLHIEKEKMTIEKERIHIERKNLQLQQSDLDERVMMMDTSGVTQTQQKYWHQ